MNLFNILPLSRNYERKRYILNNKTHKNGFHTLKY